MIHHLNPPDPTRAIRSETPPLTVAGAGAGPGADAGASAVRPGRLAGADLADGARLLGGVRGGMLECTRALGQLQAMLSRERLYSAQLQAAAAGAQGRLEELQRELEATRAQERLARHRALHDGLTSLPNRSHFRQQLDAALRRPPGSGGAPHTEPHVGVLYVDLDGMKAVNDTHGHCVGDEVLKIVASRLQRAVRVGDLVSRLGGDEFALLVTELPPSEQAALRVGRLADALGRSVAAPMRVGDVELSVRASIGIALHPVQGSCADTLLQSADAAMYHAKRGRVGYAFFEAAAG